MKIQRKQSLSKGFTLIELMVAMAVTTMIVTVLVSITAISLDTWTRSRSEVRAARQAKSMADTMARDLEALVVRRGNNIEWLTATAEAVKSAGSQEPGIRGSNSAKLIFYTAPTDRYDGKLVIDNDPNKPRDGAVGDISCVGYSLEYRDPMADATSGTEIPTFVLYRNLVNPDKTYKELLSKAKDSTGGLETAFDTAFGSEAQDTDNFVCENVFQYTITFNVMVSRSSGTGISAPILVPVTLSSQGGGATEFKLTGGAITTNSTGISGVTAEELKTGSLTSVEVSLTVLTDFGMEQMRNRKFNSMSAQADFLAKNSYQYSKSVQVPSP